MIHFTKKQLKEIAEVSRNPLEREESPCPHQFFEINKLSKLSPEGEESQKRDLWEKEANETN
jgi:hypothetical protein